MGERPLEVEDDLCGWELVPRQMISKIGTQPLVINTRSFSVCFSSRVQHQYRSVELL